MPELPEVETVRKGLQQLVSGKLIQRVTIHWHNIVATQLPIADWCDLLSGQIIQTVSRRGKYLIFQLDDWHLVSHLRMEGKFHHYQDGTQPHSTPKHVHAIFTFADGSQLHYEDVRKFGRFELLPQGQLDTFFAQKKLGPEPTWATFKLEPFIEQLQVIRKPIKPALLEQKLVVGLGNIYVDETLFRTRVHPQTPANCLTYEAMVHLHQHIIEVLQEAVEAGGSTIRTYLNSLGEAGSFQTTLAVYGRTGEPCVQCQTPIAKMKLAGRGTHYCPVCQEDRHV